MNEPSILSPLVRRWERRVSLSEDDRRALIALPCTRRAFSRDAYLVRDGEPTTSCHLLISGFGYRQKVLSDGSRQIISIHIPGEFVDLQNFLLQVSDHNVQSLGRTEVAIIPKRALSELVASRPQVARALWLETLIDASIFREWVVNVGRRDARARISHLLCELVLRLRASGLFHEESCQFPLTQEQLADATGLTAVHTNRTLQALRKEGLIRLYSSELTVLD
ncbi:MAG TPA: Crp/Fnr family transcriptional regulator [Allosphingosinicella sp.]|nr:Crp/Fnr family transcriptional regulator [Allosphingosinicella sp.]